MLKLTAGMVLVESDKIHKYTAYVLKLTAGMVLVECDKIHKYTAYVLKLTAGMVTNAERAIF